MWVDDDAPPPSPVYDAAEEEGIYQAWARSPSVGVALRTSALERRAALRRSWQPWRDATRKARTLGTLQYVTDRTLVGLRRRLALAPRLLRWHAAAAALDREAARRILAFRASPRFAAWRAAAASSKAAGGGRARRDALRAAATKMRLDGFFTAWVGRIVVRAAAGVRSRRARKLWRTRALFGALQRWTACAVTTQEAELRWALATAWRTSRAASRALAALGDALARARRRAHSRGVAVLHRRPAALARAWRATLAAAARRRSDVLFFAPAKARAAARRRRRAWASWRALLGRRVDLPAQASEVREWRLERLVWRAFGRFARFVALKQRRRDEVEVLRAQHAWSARRLGFRHWRKFAAQWHESRHKMAWLRAMIWYGCMRSIFVAWAGVLEARVHTALTMRVNYNRWKASNALRGWANQTRMADWQRNTLVCGVRFDFVKRCGGALLAWRTRHRLLAKVRRIARDFAGATRADVLRRIVRAWGAHVARRGAAHAAALRCRRLVRRSAAARHFGAWRREYRINTDADAHWRRRLLGAAVPRWWRHAAADDASQRAHADWSRCLRGFRRWRAAAAARGWRRAAAATVAIAYRRRRLGPAVGAWVMWSDRAAFGDALHAVTVTNARRRVLVAWAEAAADAGRRVTAELHAASVWKRRRMARLVHAWHAAAAARAADQRAVAAMGAQRARRERDAWWALWRRRLAQRRWAQAAAERRAVACGRLHVDAWRRLAGQRRRARALVQRHLLGDVAARFRTWRRAAAAGAATRAFELAWLEATAVACWRALREAARMGRQEDARLAEAEVRLTARLRDDGAARGKARVALDRWRLRGATAALNAWAHYAHGRLHRRLGKAAALDHAYGRCAARALHGWKAVTWHEQLRRAARSAMYGGGVAGSERRVFGAATPAPAAATARVLSYTPRRREETPAASEAGD